MFCTTDPLGPPGNCDISGSTTQFSWGSDPTVVTTRAADGFVGYVTLATSVANSGNGKTDEVVIAMSNDAGSSFTTTDLVSVAGPDTCDTGTQDQPHAFIDSTTSPLPTLWVVWRHAGSGVYGGCIRGGTITTSPKPTINWFDRGHSVANMQHSFGPEHVNAFETPAVMNLVSNA
jgi:hypothetical protein